MIHIKQHNTIIKIIISLDLEKCLNMKMKKIIHIKQHNTIIKIIIVKCTLQIIKINNNINNNINNINIINNNNNNLFLVNKIQI